MRSSKRRLGLLVLALLLVVCLAGVVNAQGEGVLEGQVVNGTADGAQIGSGIPIVLHVLQGDITMDTLDAVTDGGGTFRFDGLDVDPTLDYWPEAVYLDVTYSPTEPLRFGDDQAPLEATVTVHETTEDDSAIIVDSVHIIAESFGEALRVSEIHLFGNTGDRTYVGSSKDGEGATTLSIPLPEGAVGLAFGEGTPEGRFVETAGLVLDTEPVPPGQGTAMAFFSYHLMVMGDTVPLERRFFYPVNNLNVLAAQPGLSLASDQLLSMGAESFQGQQYEYFVGQGLGPDAPLFVELTPVAGMGGDQGMVGMPAGNDPAASASVRGNQELLRWLGMGLAALAVIGAIVYAAVTRSSTGTQDSETDLAADPETRRLVVELADLEDSFDAGQIDEVTYKGRRAELVRELKSSNL